MATALATRIANLQREVSGQLSLIHRQMEQIEKQQAVLDVQFRRIADIQAELDHVKASVRRAATTFAALLIDPHHHVSAGASSSPSVSAPSA